MHLTIAMPAYNEEDAIETVIRTTLKVLDQVDPQGEVLVLDDCSTDRTVEILRKLQSQDARVRIEQNEINRGVPGFERRLIQEARGDWVFMGSSDGETDYNDVARFLETALKENADLVIGYRNRKIYKMYRMVVSWSYNTLVKVCFGGGITDAGWVKLFRRSAIAPIPLYSQSAFVSAERLLAAKRLRLKIVQLPSAHLARIGGRGRGGSPSWIIASVRDLLLTRLRWFAFQKYYRPRHF